ncbi:MAG: hypothetical protein Q7U47_16130 [Paludibacter sp.]|nr:hypothetical protein [Paludibacter sp.]
MFQNLKSQLTRNLLNIPGWHTRRKIVVIESDDWGSIRMPSREVYEKFLKAGIRVDQCHYCSNDSLENERDLSGLFEVLTSVKDSQGKPALITANTVVANPDFDKIRESHFEKYHYKLITESYKESVGSANSFELIKEGNQKGLFSLQSHGREHLNTKRWLHYLRNDYPETKFAFENAVYGISTTISAEKRKSFLPAFDFETYEEEEEANEIVRDGLRIFEKLFGFTSESFIAPNYIWSKSLEKSIAVEGVRFIQGARLHTYRVPVGEKATKRMRYIGKKNEFEQIDLVRNAFFEPSEKPEKDLVNSCLNEISSAFLWKHPAVICTHRVNFMGGLNQKNRDQNLLLLKKLLSEIVKCWPDVEFMSSNELGNIILKDKNE